jgi:chromosome segregation ATPase
MAAAGESNSAEMRKMEGQLKAMRIMLIANLAILAVLLLLVFRLSQQLAENRDELKQLRMQAQSAVGQLTPSLDARLSVFEKRMDSVDGKMKNAEDRMVTGMDAKMKSAEDRMVERMNAEIPAMLDKYINRKLTEVKH